LLINSSYPTAWPVDYVFFQKPVQCHISPFKCIRGDLPSKSASAPPWLSLKVGVSHWIAFAYQFPFENLGRPYLMQNGL
jgi:hypothetical protein